MKDWPAWYWIKMLVRNQKKRKTEHTKLRIMCRHAGVGEESRKFITKEQRVGWKKRTLEYTQNFSQHQSVLSYANFQINLLLSKLILVMINDTLVMDGLVQHPIRQIGIRSFRTHSKTKQFAVCTHSKSCCSTFCTCLFKFRRLVLILVGYLKF